MSASTQTAERKSRDARHAQVVAAASGLFLSKGFNATSIKDITDIVGGSRRDIYEMFTDKEGLFEAVLQSLIANILVPVGSTLQLQPSDDIARDLNRLGLKLLENLLDRSTLTIFRQFVAIGAERPDIGRQAYLSGPVALYTKLETYFKACVRDGQLVIEDVPATARMFVEMLKGDYQLRALMTNESDFDQAELAQHVEKAVALFLRGASPR